MRRRGQREHDLERELRAHLEAEAAEQRAGGLTAEEARLAALRAFGNAAYIQEEVREMWGWASLSRFWQDVRYGIRTLRHAPAFTLAAALSLALGIGANTAIFSLLNAVALRLLPVEQPRQLVQFIYTLPPNGPNDWNSWFGYPNLERFRKEARSVSAIISQVSLGRVNVAAGGSSDIGSADACTDSFFSVLGVKPERGRLFMEGDDREGADALVLSDSYWRARFGGDPAIIGGKLLLDQLPFTVVGIAPAGFGGVYAGISRDMWVPLHALDRFKPNPQRWHDTFSSWLMIAGRLRPGVSLEQAQAELDVIHRREQERQLAESPQGASLKIQQMVRDSHLKLLPAGSGMAGGFLQSYKLPLELLLGISGVVLLIACANVANLVLARAAHRRREIAVRMALVAGRARVVRQLLIENLLVAAAGGVVALALAWWGGAALVRMISTGEAPVPLDVRPDWTVFGFTTAVSLACGAIFGLAPALRGTRVDPGAALKEGVRGIAGGSRFADRALVAGQVMLSLALLSAAGLFARTLENLRDVDVGYDRQNILMFSVDARLGGYPPARSGALYRAILEKAAALPGVQSAAVSIVRPVDDYYYLVDRIHEVDGRVLPDAETIKVAWNAMGPGYFATVGTPLLLGRDFEPRDADSPARVVMVNESLAHKALPGQNPIGHRLDGAQIIGVVKDSLYGGAREQSRPVLYRPLLQKKGGADPSGWVGVGAVSFELRYRSGAGLAEGVRQAVASVDRNNVPVFRVKTLRTQSEDALLRERLLATVSSFFGALALALACLGLYGLLAYAVSRRTAEIGIRMALGARRSAIVWLVMREAMWLVAAGAAAGVPLAIWLAQCAKSVLFGVKGGDPLTLAGAAATLVAVAALASCLPARRAARTDPMTALRYE